MGGEEGGVGFVVGVEGFTTGDVKEEFVVGVRDG